MTPITFIIIYIGVSIMLCLAMKYDLPFRKEVLNYVESQS
jgi:hypothetical protein